MTTYKRVGSFGRWDTVLTSKLWRSSIRSWMFIRYFDKGIYIVLSLNGWGMKVWKLCLPPLALLIDCPSEKSKSTYVSHTLIGVRRGGRRRNKISEKYFRDESHLLLARCQGGVCWIISRLFWSEIVAHCRQAREVAVVRKLIGSYLLSEQVVGEFDHSHNPCRPRGES